MQDSDCVTFLQWALPQMQMRWPGFRRVHKRVCRRLARRLVELGLSDPGDYRDYLAAHPDEWQRLDTLCRVVVTRFYRDKRVFSELAEVVLPQLARQALRHNRGVLRAWSIGSASGEEAYTLAILWQLLLAVDFPQLKLQLLGTEVEPHLIARSHRASYPAATIKNLPEPLRTAAFIEDDGEYRLRSMFKKMVMFRKEDIRSELPEGQFDLILCRNLVFTYYDAPLQQATLGRILTRLRPGGWLLLGAHETLPAPVPGLEVVSERLGLYRHG